MPLLIAASFVPLFSPRIREVFRSLGCTVEAISAEDRKRMGMSVQDAKSSKRAILQAPPVFPLAKRGPPQR